MTTTYPPESRRGELAQAIQSVGLPADAPWSQVVTALTAAGFGNVLAGVGADSAPASTDGGSETAVASPAEGSDAPASEIPPPADAPVGSLPPPAADPAPSAAPAPTPADEAKATIASALDTIRGALEKLVS